MTRGGLLISGVAIPVEGVDIENPLTAEFCKLGPEDYRTRHEQWVRSIGVHSTKGIHPQHIIPGEGPDGMEQVVADYWRKSEEGKRRQSSAQVVVGCKWNEAACLGDLVRQMAYHAKSANPYSWGLEMYQLANGGIYEATLATTVKILRVACEVMMIPFQFVSDRYTGGPVHRLVNGGPDVIGIWGHRDQTGERGRGDPGDAIYRELELAGAEPMRLAQGEDLVRWGARQRKLNRIDEVLQSGRAPLTVDGLAGPGTIRRMREHGFANGREIDAAVEAQ